MAARLLTVLAAVMAAGAFAGIPRIETAGADFKLDGRLDDAAWTKAAKLGDLVEIRTPDAPPPQNATTVWAFYDVENLYVAFRCLDARMDKVQLGLPAGQATDVPIASGADTVEMLISPVGRDGEFYHLRVVPSGAKADMKCRRTDETHCLRDATWNGDWEVKTTQDAAGWTVEARIPFRIFAEADFGFAAATPAKGDVIRINCGRYASVLGETTALARGLGLFHTVFPEFTCDGWELGDIRLKGTDGYRIRPGTNAYPFTVENRSARPATVRVRGAYVEGKAKQPSEQTFELQPGETRQGAVTFVSQGGAYERLTLTADWLRMKGKIATLVTADGEDLGAKARKADLEGPKILARTIDGLRAKNPGRAFALGTASASEKVFRDLPYEGRFTADADIALAQNEYESAQLVVFRLNGKPGPLEVEVGDLTGPDGAVIRGADVAVHQVGFVNVGDSGHHVHAGYWPDVLYPGRTVPPPVKGRVQSVMLTVKSAKDQRPGVYRGEVTFRGDGDERKGTLTAEVWPFTLPDTLSLRMNIWFHGIYVAWFYDNFPFPPDFFRSFMETCGRYRFAAGIRGNMVEAVLRETEDPAAPDGYRFDFEPLAPYYDIALANGANVLNFDSPGTNHFVRPIRRSFVKRDGSLDFFRPSDPQKAADRCFVELREWFRRKGYWPRAVLQVGDEPWSEKQQRAIRETVADMKVRYGEIPPVVTAGAVRGKTNLDGTVDIWCPQVPQYVAADYAGMDRTKERLWLYQCLFKQDYPSFQIDRPSAEPRINGLVCRKCGAEGFLYWSSVQWTSSDVKSADYKSKKANPWVHEEWGFPILGCPGDGCFVYPTKDGVVPSLRAQYIRDGAEDYEYVEILARRLAAAVKSGRLSAADRARAERLVRIPDEVVRAPNAWTTSSAALEAYRREVARMIIGISE